MSTHCYVPVLGKRLRITQLDECGNIPDGAQQIVTDGFVSVTLSSETEDGAEILKKNASGHICVNEKLSDSFKYFGVEIEFCGVNPSLLSMVTLAEEYNDYASDVAGFTVREGEINKQFALELWTGLAGQACAPGQTGQAGGYLLLPFVAGGVFDDITADGENDVSFKLTGANTKGGNLWGQGRYQVVYNGDEPPTPDVLPTELDPYDHMLLIDTAVAPPPVACDPADVPDAPTPPADGGTGA